MKNFLLVSIFLAVLVSVLGCAREDRSTVEVDVDNPSRVSAVTTGIGD